jgi:hypothetical protein
MVTIFLLLSKLLYLELLWASSSMLFLLSLISFVFYLPVIFTFVLAINDKHMLTVTHFQQSPPLALMATQHPNSFLPL